MTKEKELTREEEAELAGRIVNPFAVQMAITSSLSNSGNWGPMGKRTVAGELYSIAVANEREGNYAGMAAEKAAQEAYLNGGDPLQANISNGDIADMAYKGVIESEMYKKLTVGQMAAQYGVGDVDESIANKYLEDLNPEDPKEAALINMYDSFEDKMGELAINIASGRAFQRTSKNIEDIVKPADKTD